MLIVVSSEDESVSLAGGASMLPVFSRERRAASYVVKGTFDDPAEGGYLENATLRATKRNVLFVLRPPVARTVPSIARFVALLSMGFVSSLDKMRADDNASSRFRAVAGSSDVPFPACAALFMTALAARAMDATSFGGLAVPLGRKKTVLLRSVAA